MDILKHSIEVILANQDQGGAYIASPAFPIYHYCWLRDGSFIAHSMDRAGQYESAVKYFRWVGRTIQRYAGKVDVLAAQLKAGKKPDHQGILNTRFSLDGEEEGSESGWGNFQIDGYGTWLWALAEHVRLSEDTSLLKELSQPIQTTLRYLELTWNLPNYDCWEEHPEYLHPYSLASVFAGFDAIATLIQNRQMDAVPVAAGELANQVKAFLLNYAVDDGRLVKHILPASKKKPPKAVALRGVDSSLIAVTIPYNVLSPKNEVMQATIQKIVADLYRVDGGVYRYKADVYYGGGEWLLLTAWLGWYFAQSGDIQQAETMRAWMESQADAAGNLPEQVSDHTLAPEHFDEWRNKWGPIASPLLWSHAMYIVLVKAIEEAKSRT